VPVVDVDKSMTDKIIEDDKLLAEQVKIVDGNIVINVAYEYPISLDRCRTADEVLEWVYDLTEKTWMTNEVMRRFIFFARGAIEGKV